MAIYLGNTQIDDFYEGNKAVDRIYLGQSKIYDAFAEISGELPLSYKARRAENLKNYCIYGTSGGAGVETENLFNKDDTSLQISDCIFYLGTFTNSKYTSYAPCYVIFIPVTEGNTYTCSFSQNPSSGNVTFSSVFSIDKPSIGVSYIINDISTFVNHGTSVTEFTREAPAEANWMAVQIATADNLDNNIMIVQGSTPPASYIPPGYKIPLTLESGEQSQDIPIYIGPTKLGAEEYVDFGEQKIYKDVSGTLAPTDPPAPLQPIPSYAGANRLYSTITLGEVTVQGRIKNNLPEWYKDGWQDLLGPDSWYEPWRVIVAAATKPSSGTIPNCTIVYGSFQDYHEFNRSAINIKLTNSELTFTRANDWKKRKFVTYDSNTGTWGSVTSQENGGYFYLQNIVQNIPVKAFIIFTTPNYPAGYNTNIPYQDDL